MMHALFILASMLALGPLMAYVPLASLAAVLVIVAWNMSEHERFRHLLGGVWYFSAPEELKARLDALIGDTRW